MAVGAAAALTPSVDAAVLRSSTAGQAQPPPLSYLGQSYRGLPLTHRGLGPGRSVSFVYGDCDPGLEGCYPPLEVQNWLLRRRHPSMFDKNVPCTRTSVRGVPVAFFASSGGLEVYIGRRVVVVFADRPRQMLRAARALRRVGRARPPETFPKPPPSVARAIRRCRPLSPELTG